VRAGVAGPDGTLRLGSRLAAAVLACTCCVSRQCLSVMTTTRATPRAPHAPWGVLRCPLGVLNSAGQGRGVCDGVRYIRAGHRTLWTGTIPAQVLHGARWVARSKYKFEESQEKTTDAGDSNDRRGLSKGSISSNHCARLVARVYGRHDR